MHRPLSLLTAVAVSLVLAACGGGNESPFGDPSADTQEPAAVASTPAPPATGGETEAGEPPVAEAPPAAASTTPAKPLEPLATTPAQAPSPTGTTPDDLPRDSEPSDLSAEERLEADQTAMLNARTMVSVIEGCHSGRESYRDCNSHEELGDESTLGLRIGKKTGEVQISATENGFRVTAHSLSGAKFTVARGPRGDRFKCLAGPESGACPENRAWKW